ncbi:MAG: TorF family putative porin [Pseudomonadota bacterium]
MTSRCATYLLASAHADRSGLQASDRNLGAWASTITWIRDSGAYASNPSANMEIDTHGGLKRSFEFNKDFSYDIGFLDITIPGVIHRAL